MIGHADVPFWVSVSGALLATLILALISLWEQRR